MKLPFVKNINDVIKKVVPYTSYFVGAVVLGVFGYMGLTINDAFNVKPDESVQQTTRTIVFDQKTVDTIKGLRVVPGDVSVGPQGKSDPFGN